MPSLISGFEYDIFISYRQKDNKYDGWVTEFVSNLRKELEATFKEDVSIYFDINPHDGLHDNYDVDDSLKEKLKCLILIPIVSKTYCDPNSFAWQKEFRAFIAQANQDSFGLKLKLLNGNTTSRVLPIRIHELETEDVKLYEGETGAVLRPIDFIFKSTGVNRPLLPSDKKEDNASHTLYRDQVNKVANAIQEIVDAMKKPYSKTESNNRARQNSESKKPSFKKWAAIIVLALLIISSGIGYFIFQNPNQLKDPAESGLAILPFTNNTGSADLDFYGLGMASEVRTKLSMSKQFDFISSLQATMTYSKSPKTLIEIGDELNVDYILSGLYQKSGSKIKVEAEFIDASTGKLIWSLPLERELNDIFEVQKAIANEVLKRFSALNQISEKSSSQNIDAYSLYLKGLEEANLTATQDSSKIKAIEFLESAIKIDSLFSDAWVQLVEVESFMFNNVAYNKKRKDKLRWYTRYIASHFPNTWQNDVAQGLYLYRVGKQFDQARIFFEQALAKDEENFISLATLAALYKRKFEFDMSIKYSKKVLSIHPTNAMAWDNLSETLSLRGDYKNSIKAQLKSWEYGRSGAIANDVVLKAMAINNLSILPEEVKTSATDFAYWKKLGDRDLQGLKKDAYQNNRDDWKSIGWYELGMDDSARHYASSAVRKGESDIIFLALARDTVRALALINAYSKHQIVSGEDKMISVYAISSSIGYDCSIKNYKRATESLLKINANFPEFGGYDWFNHPFFDRIKKEYPHFQEALNNIKRQPMVNVEEYIKF